MSDERETPTFDPEMAAGEAYPLLQQAVGSIVKGSDEEAHEEIAQVLLATMFRVGAQSDILEQARGGAGLRKEAFARLAAGETAPQIFEAAENREA